MIIVLPKKLWPGVALGVFLGLGLYPLLGVDPNAAYDWRTFFYPQLASPYSVRLLNPLWVYLPLYPLRWLSSEWSYVVFCLLSFACAWIALRSTGASRYAFLVSAPLIDLLFLGNLDVFVALGVAIGWLSVERRRPYLLGLSIALLLIKPHVGLPVALLYLWWLRDWRALTVPIAAMLLSQTFFGWSWPILWLRALLAARGNVAGPMSVSMYPIGLLAWLALLVPMPRLDRLRVVLIATFLSVPYAGLYSLVALLVLPLPFWAYPLISADLLLIGPRFVNEMSRHVWAPRLALLLVLLWFVLCSHWHHYPHGTTD